MKSQHVIKVYYDGLCKICSREINHYRRQQGAEKIQFIDICGIDFDPNAENVDPVEVHKVLHVRRFDGTLAIRVDAFIEIWKVLPRYQILARMAGQSVLRFILSLGYQGFSVIRTYLPRYSSQMECKNSPYCEVKKV